ncbi:MAG: hypothetical protein A3K45_06760 [Chloroflexi bacterium RIFOXYC12_FULL_59_14]|nr:MAG: hypothetical protein A3K45_06760 [Chloroflexi bacterium RIFOXYC12_FULL_59_14]
MGFVTIEDIQGSIELVLFPKTWASYQPILEQGKIVLVEGKVDAGSTPPKILVDTIRTEFAMLVPAGETAQASPHLGGGLKPRSVSESPRRPESFPTLRSASVQKATQPPKPIPPKPAVGRIGNPTYATAEAAPAYQPAPVERDNISLNNDDTPPPPDNFPAGWDSEWQPSFENAVIAARPEPKVSRDTISTYTPPHDPISPPEMETREESQEIEPISNVAVSEPRVQRIEAETASPLAGETGERSAPPILPSIYIPLAEAEDRDHPPQQITILLRPSHDKEIDKRRIKTIYGTLISFHGRDRFSFQIFENGKGHLIDFPNDTTRICPELLARLKKVAGEESWRIEPILLQ